MRAVAFALVLFSAFAAQPAQADDPSDVVNDIYRHYLDPQLNITPIEDNPAILTGRLNKLFDDYNARSSPDEVGMLDFDPFISAQDYEIKDVAIASETVAGDQATIVVEFTNFDYQTELTYSFVREGGAWKIDDIASGNPDDPWVLSKILKGE